MGAPSQFDVIVIGGGASGLAAALSAARSGATVAVIERDVACGVKILATGNGRCNLSNAHLDPERFNDPAFVRTVMEAEPERELDFFFSSLGIMTVEEEGRLYPRSLKAESVRDALLHACKRCGVHLLPCHTVTKIDRALQGTWCVSANLPAGELKVKPQKDRKGALRAQRKALETAQLKAAEFKTHALVIATGGGADAIPHLLGIESTPGKPVLCPVAAKATGIPHALGTLDGLRSRALVTLKHDGACTWSESGEILFRPYGISGVVAFNLSRRVAPGDTILLDFFPEMDRKTFHQMLIERQEIMGAFTPSDPSWFDGMLAPALAQVACSIYEQCHPGTADVAHLVSILKHFKLTATGLTEKRSAQVTRGGIPLTALTAPNLELTGAAWPCIYACGEALDIDADCGGYNLAWAWLSGIRCGTAAARA